MYPCPPIWLKSEGDNYPARGGTRDENTGHRLLRVLVNVSTFTFVQPAASPVSAAIRWASLPQAALITSLILVSGAPASFSTLSAISSSSFRVSSTSATKASTDSLTRLDEKDP